MCGEVYDCRHSFLFNEQGSRVGEGGQAGDGSSKSGRGDPRDMMITMLFFSFFYSLLICLFRRGPVAMAINGLLDGGPPLPLMAADATLALLSALSGCHLAQLPCLLPSLLLPSFPLLLYCVSPILSFPFLYVCV